MTTDSADAAAVECRRVRAHGRVQGVGYRDGCVRQARALSVSGWVRNRADGTVEALLQGAPQQLDALCSWMRAGPPGARVERLDIAPGGAPDANLQGFAQRPTA